MHTSMILVDLQKVFDTLYQGLLFEKLKYFGFCASLIKWFESYLSNKKFLIFVDNVFFETGTLNYSVSKDSIVGLFFFLLRVNDLPNHYHTFATICMQMVSVFSTNKRTLKKLKMFQIKSFCQ